MYQRRIFKGIKTIFVIALACAVFGFVVRELWNALIPPIFGWHTITFWQGIGLLILSKILFGGFHRPFGGRGGRWKQRMQERMEHMTPEQREQFRRGMRCGRNPFAAPVEPQV
jgi:hypothetical protein